MKKLFTTTMFLAAVAGMVALGGCGGADTPPVSRGGGGGGGDDTTTDGGTTDGGTTDGGTADGTTDGGAADGAAPAEGGWGDLTGRFVVEGTVPEPKKLDVSKEPGCVNLGVVDESIVTGEGGGLANVVIWLRTKDAPVHESYAETENAEVLLDNKGCRFAPHVCLLRTTQQLVIKNSDPFGHNTNVSSLKGQGFNEIIPQGKQSDPRTLSREEFLPVNVACNIHPWMQARLVVRESPYMAVSGEDGTFTIKNLPTGELEFQAWHEKSGYLAVGSWSRGRFEVAIRPGENTVGDVQVPAELLLKN